MTGRGNVAAIADYNNDGFLDILVGNGLGTSPGPYELLENSGNLNNWLRIIPVNAGGSPKFGARIYVTTPDGTQYREFVDQSSNRDARR